MKKRRSNKAGRRAKAYVRLLDVDVMNPGIPPAKVKKGDMVKVVFKPQKIDGLESMWLMVTGRSGKGFKGFVNSSPRGLKYKTPVRFEPRHVIDVWRQGINF